METPTETEQIVLVALSVTAADHIDAQAKLMPHIVQMGKNVRNDFTWWFAEDERIDGSDNESAILIPAAFSQMEAYMGLTMLLKKVVSLITEAENT